MKLVELVPVPTGVRTAIRPVVAPSGTVVVICPAETTVNGADTPLKVTAEAPVKLAPLMVTRVVASPLVGEKLVMRGPAVKSVELVPVPPGFVTTMRPVFAAVGTVAVICAGDRSKAGTKVKVAGAPPNVTAVTLLRFAPVIVTETPATPLAGEKLAIRGATTKLVLLPAVPAIVVTLIGPENAPAGTVAVICPAEFTVKLAEIPPNFTLVAPVKLAPLITTWVPGPPAAGEKLPIRGAAVKSAELVAVPPGVVTAMRPLTAVDGTVAVIWVLELTTKVAATPPKLTCVAPVKFVPAMVTAAPAAPVVGLNALMVGTPTGIAVAVAVGAGVGDVTVKLPELEAAPPGPVTPMGPVAAPVGTVATIRVADVTVKVAVTPPTVTALASVKLAPPRISVVPGGPLVGEKLLIEGGLVVVEPPPVAVA